MCGKHGAQPSHKKIQAPEPFCLSLDITGPFKPGVDQVLKAPRYFLVGTYTVPVDASANALVEGIKDLGGTVTAADDQLEHVFPNPSPSGLDEAPEMNAQAEVADPLAEDQPELGEIPLTEAEVSKYDMLSQKWKEHIEALSSVEVRTLTMAIPLKSRQAKEVVSQVSLLYCRLRSLNLPVYRVHVDRAKEFIGQEFQQWLSHRDLWLTTTAADEPQSNGRAEAAVHQSSVQTTSQSGSVRRQSTG